MGITIKEIREKTGYTQKQFSEKYEIPISTLRKWEQGESRPAPYVIKMLAESIPSENDDIRVITGKNGRHYYYDEVTGTLSDNAGTVVRIRTDIKGVKSENLPIYVKELFESYYEILEKFERDCRYDRSDDIIWS